MNEKLNCITINCGCCGSSGGQSGDSLPVGSVISYMGTKAPNHYLICNGAALNITDYVDLSRQISEEFGSVNFFGGDGFTTFAVPDLRNEFLRGYRGGAVDQLSGDIGKHQDATVFPNIGVGNLRTQPCLVGGCDNLTNTVGIENYDTIRDREGYVAIDQIKETPYVSYKENCGSYTAHTTNVAVLYCIKY